MMWSLYIIGLVLSVLVFRQCREFRSVKRVLRELAGAFEKPEDEVFLENHADGVAIRYGNELTREITEAVNSSLRGGRSVLITRSMLYDMVERPVERREEEARSKIVLPLYMGLIGTMAGVVIGLFTLTINWIWGGTGLEDSSAISELLLGVALAMVGSLLGLLFTTILTSRKSKSMSACDKGRLLFFAELQERLLPQSTNTFVETVSGLGEKFQGLIVALESHGRGFEQGVDALSERVKVQQEALAQLMQWKSVAAEITAGVKYLSGAQKLASGFVPVVEGMNTALGALHGMYAQQAKSERARQSVQERQRETVGLAEIAAETETRIDRFFVRMTGIDVREGGLKMAEAAGRVKNNLEQLDRAFASYYGTLCEKLEETSGKLGETLVGEVRKSVLALIAQFDEVVGGFAEVRGLHDDVSIACEALRSSTADRSRGLEEAAAALKDTEEEARAVVEEARAVLEEFQSYRSAKEAIRTAWHEWIRPPWSRRAANDETDGELQKEEVGKKKEA